MKQVKIIGTQEISCSGCELRDQIELFAIRKSTLQIVFEKDGEEQRIHGVIKDIKIKDQSEYLQLTSGVLIPFSDLISLSLSE